MATAIKQTTIRFNDAYTRSIAEKAAGLQGQSLSSFIMTAIREHGEKVIRDRTQAMREFGAIALSQRDYSTLLASMDKPPKPNKAFRDAMKRHKASELKWK